MAPFEKRCADALAPLEDERADAALDKMRCRGKPDGAGADDCDRKILGGIMFICSILLASSN